MATENRAEKLKSWWRSKSESFRFWSICSAIGVPILLGVVSAWTYAYSLASEVDYLDRRVWRLENEMEDRVSELKRELESEVGELRSRLDDHEIIGGHMSESEIEPLRERLDGHIDRWGDHKNR
ncbi:MAG: hypothetical protein V3W37_10545 [Candidatus Binatia bacterium]